MIKYIFSYYCVIYFVGKVEKINHLLLSVEFLCFKNNINCALFTHNIWKVQLKQKEKLEVTHNNTTGSKH